MPWVDKQGGFLIGDRNEDEARRAIREDCLGCLLYATPTAFERPFITQIEIPTAFERLSADAGFLIVTVPRKISFAELAAKSKEAFSFNLAEHHCIPVSDDSLADGFAKVARETLVKLVCGHSVQATDRVRIQYSTREILPGGGGELLCIDGRSVYTADGFVVWDDLLSGLHDVKSAISSAFGRPRIIVDGSKHLSSAFLFGRVFQPFPLEIRQTAADYWLTTGPPAPLQLDVTSDLKSCEELIVTVASGRKALHAVAVQTVNITNASWLRISPQGGRFNLTADSSRWLADAVYAHIDEAVSKASPSRIHLFMAIPQATAMTLGQKFAGTPDTIVYDWKGNGYDKGRLVPRGVL
jgi:hypothetical protein